MGLSGKLTASELLIREAERVVKVPIYRKGELSDPNAVADILGIASPGSVELLPSGPNEHEPSAFHSFPPAAYAVPVSPMTATVS